MKMRPQLDSNLFLEDLPGLTRISHTHLLRDDQVLAWLRQTAQFVLDV